jgi:hypothetical protein
MSNRPSHIVSYFHCARCQQAKPSNESMKKWARFNVGLTSTGVEVWCVRHEMLVVHLTAEQLTAMLRTPLQCSCCPLGQHVVTPADGDGRVN